MRIGLDVMGGDHAPGAILEGAAASLDGLQPDDQLVLFGDNDVIKNGLVEYKIDDPRIEIVATTQSIGMEESPVEAVRSKPDSSMAVMAQMASKRNAEPLSAIISAGNTGAQVTAAQMFMRRLPGVQRPGVACTVPSFHGPVVLLDVGANIDPKPQHLAQYGLMGETFARSMLGIERPRIALMNVGGEEQKGTDTVRQARDLLTTVDDLNFVGYVEGRDVFEGGADVVLTDGMVGNVVLKLAEGLSAGIFKAIAREVAIIDPELAQRFDPVVRKIYADHDYHEYGGAPLLGVNGVCIISHGSSVGRTIANAVHRARSMAASSMNNDIVTRLAGLETRTTAAEEVA